MTQRGSSPKPELQAPTVRFGPDFGLRLEKLVLRMSAASERREGIGSASMSGGGEEFVAFRPYRPGEDLRGLDWNLYARLDRPYVKVTRREAAQVWAVLVDTSASMGVGPPGKLQAAAELAVGVAAVGLRQGARVQVAFTGRSVREGARSQALHLTVRSLRDLHVLKATFEQQIASGESGIGHYLANSRPVRDAGRLIVIGDLLDLEPKRMLSLARPGLELALGRVLAPLELSPRAGSSVEWVDPESGERKRMLLDSQQLNRYERALETELEAWSHLAGRHGWRYCCFSSETPFEDMVRGLLERR
ncbi:MAG: hypothetical protein ACI841_003220 [Planctomycetota bacterium]|jgi:uncharacterized protein (DUF58 family)